MQVRDPKAGLILKLVGTTKINHSTGQLEAIFKDLPPLPFEEVMLTLKGGPRAPFATPQTCGGQPSESFSSIATLTPSDSPESADATPSSPLEDFEVKCAAEGKFSPGLSAGTAYPAAGQFSDFSLTLSRKDGEGDLSGIEVKTPPGLTAKIAGVHLCAEPQANEGCCPESSQIGTVTALSPAQANAHSSGQGVYLTGPSDGSGACTLYASGCAPSGLSMVLPAEAGPFPLKARMARATPITRRSSSPARRSKSTRRPTRSRSSQTQSPGA